MLKDLIKVANKLDSLGLTKEADKLDAIIRKVAARKKDSFDAGVDDEAIVDEGFEMDDDQRPEYLAQRQEWDDIESARQIEEENEEYERLAPMAAKAINKAARLAEEYCKRVWPEEFPEALAIDVAGGDDGRGIWPNRLIVTIINNGDQHLLPDAANKREIVFDVEKDNIVKWKAFGKVLE